MSDYESTFYYALNLGSTVTQRVRYGISNFKAPFFLNHFSYNQSDLKFISFRKNQILRFAFKDHLLKHFTPYKRLTLHLLRSITKQKSEANFWKSHIFNQKLCIVSEIETTLSQTVKSWKKFSTTCQTLKQFLWNAFDFESIFSRTRQLLNEHSIKVSYFDSTF